MEKLIKQISDRLGSVKEAAEKSGDLELELRTAFDKFIKQNQAARHEARMLSLAVEMLLKELPKQ